MGALQEKLLTALNYKDEQDYRKQNPIIKSVRHDVVTKKVQTQPKAIIKKFDPNDIESFIWKGAKKLVGDNKYSSDKIRLIDATPEELKTFYNHCKTMLHNEDRKNLGRIPLLKQVEDSRHRCGVELFYRDSIKDGSSRFSIVDSLKTSVKNRQLTNTQIEDLVLSNLLTVHPDYYNLPYKLLIEGGVNSLGRFDRKNITLTFILKHGVWLTEEEKTMFPEPDSKSKLKAIKAYLRLPEESVLTFNAQTGLSVKQMKSMTLLKIKKYEEMSDDQLRTLRYKLLFSLEDQINYHIGQWNSRIEQIKKVAAHRNIEI